MLLNILEYVGTFVVAKIIFLLIREIYFIFQSDPDVQKKYGKGCWAVVTGSTDGIGRGFVEELAQQGVNVVLVARNVEKAQQVVKETQPLNKQTQFMIVEADFAKCLDTKDFFANIYEQVKKLDIGLIVNNIGVGLEKSFLNSADEDVKKLITLNCIPVVMMTKALLPLLNQRASRSGIINLSSFMGNHIAPYGELYSASKAFDDYFSRALHDELYQKIDVLSLRPMYVTTPLTKFRVGPTVISKNECAKGCLNRMGLVDATYGHWKHRITGTLIDSFPGWLQTHMIAKQIKKKWANENKKNQ